MTQLSSHPAAKTPARQSLPGLPRTGLTPQQQLEALARVQNQAEQRVKLGLQLFKAAEAQTNSHREILEAITAEREKFRDELSQDVTRSLHAFDQWIGQMDDTFTQAFLTLGERVDAVEQKLTDSQRHLENMVNQTQKMLDQAMALLDGQQMAPKVTTKKARQSEVALDDHRTAEDASHQETIAANPTELSASMKGVSQSFIKPVPPVKLNDESDHNQLDENTEMVDQVELEDTDEPNEQIPIVQSVSYADILDRIYASRQKLK